MNFTDSAKMYIVGTHKARSGMPRPKAGTLFALITGARSSAGCGVAFIDARELRFTDESLWAVDSVGVTHWKGDADARKLASKLADVNWTHVQTDIVKPNAQTFEQDVVGLALREKFLPLGYTVEYDGSHAAMHRDWYVFKNGELVWHIEAKGRQGMLVSNTSRQALGLTDGDMSLNETFESFMNDLIG